jgi:hypothetical protein
MNSDFSKAKVGDWVWTIKDGWGKITRTGGPSVFPIRIGSNDYGIDGKYLTTDKAPSAFLVPPMEFDIGLHVCDFKEEEIEEMVVDQSAYDDSAEGFRPKTDFVKSLLATRKEAILEGMRLLTTDEILKQKEEIRMNASFGKSEAVKQYEEVIVLQYEYVEAFKKHVYTEKGGALFHGFGYDLEENGSVSAGIVEWPNGQLELVPINFIKFAEPHQAKRREE